MKKLLLLITVVFLAIFAAACDPGSQKVDLQKSLDEVKITLLENEALTKITSNIELTTKVTDESVEISWVSQNGAITISNDLGLVKRKETDTLGKLVATAKLAGVSLSVDFDLVVLANPSTSYLDEIIITYAIGEDSQTVQSSLVLTSSVSDENIIVSWKSNASSTISISGNEGIVTRSAENVVVILTVILKKDNNIYETKDFEIVVLAKIPTSVGELNLHYQFVSSKVTGTYTEKNTPFELTDLVSNTKVSFNSFRVSSQKKYSGIVLSCLKSELENQESYLEFSFPQKIRKIELNVALWSSDEKNQISEIQYQEFINDTWVSKYEMKAELNNEVTEGFQKIVIDEINTSKFRIISFGVESLATTSNLGRIIIEELNLFTEEEPTNVFTHEMVKNNLEIIYTNDDSKESVKDNLNFIKDYESARITWQTSNTQVIDINGTVTRPLYLNEIVVLTPTIIINNISKSYPDLFSVNVIKAVTIADQTLEIEMGFRRSNSYEYVSEDLILVSDFNDHLVQWRSLSPDYINNEGIINKRDNMIISVEFELTIIDFDDNTVQATKTYTLKLQPQKTLEEVSQLLEISYAEGDNSASVTKRLYIDFTFEDSTISWTSNGSEVSNSGIVYQPGIGESDVIIEFTAIASRGLEMDVSRTFTLSIKSKVFGQDVKFSELNFNKTSIKGTSYVSGLDATIYDDYASGLKYFDYGWTSIQGSFGAGGITLNGYRTNEAFISFTTDEIVSKLIIKSLGWGNSDRESVEGIYVERKVGTSWEVIEDISYEIYFGGTGSNYTVNDVQSKEIRIRVVGKPYGNKARFVIKNIQLFS